MQALAHKLTAIPGRTTAWLAMQWLFAPVSSHFPCKQGIFQGICENSAPKVVANRKKSPCRSDFVRTTAIGENNLDNWDSGPPIREKLGGTQT
jgi:hypothetical protein